MMHESHARRVALRTAAIAALLGACACSGGDKAGRGASAAGGTLVIAAAADADNLFPPLTITSQGHQVTDQLFDYLADIGPDLNTIGDRGFTPHLASSWEWAPDSLSIAFHLDPRAHWHDGPAVTASDVRFSFRLVTDTTLASPVASSLTNVDSVSVRNANTAVVWFRRRTPEQFCDFVYNLVVLPEHLLSGTPPRSLATSDFARHPVGSGRFRFAKWESGSRIELVTDPSNYRGRARLDRVVWLISPDAQAATTRFLAGEADFIEVVRGPTIGQIERTPGLRVVSTPSLDYGYLGFNLRRPLFRDRELRRALSMVLDRASMVRNVFDTLAQPGIGPLTHAQPAALWSGGGAPAVTPLPFDRASAARRLNARGPVSFHIIVPTSSAIRMQYATLLQAQYRAAGVRVTVEPLDLNAFAERLGRGEYDAALNAWHTDPSPGAVRQAWSGAALPPSGANFARYSSPAFDTLLSRAARATSADSSYSMYRSAYSTINADAPAVWLYEARAVSGVNQRVSVGRLRSDRWWSDLADWSVGPR